jgi:UDP-N-acetylglucosamine acyltransferase
MAEVHATATVETSAELAADVVVGPYAYVGPDVQLDEGVVIGPHAVVVGRTHVGAASRIFGHACLGGEPQDRTFTGEPTCLEVGRGNVIREHVTIHVGTPQGGGCTRIGDDNLIMNTAHIAHDCQIGSHCIIASFSGLAGHVRVDDHAVLGAYTGVHQFSRVGESVMAASNAKLSMDAPPFSLVAGDRARLAGLNVVGLKRRGIEDDARRALKHAFHLIFNSKLRLEEAVLRVQDEIEAVPEVERLIGFLQKSERGFCR